MWKLLSLSAVLSTLLWGAELPQAQLESFIKGKLPPHMQIQKLEVRQTLPLEQASGWMAYHLMLTLKDTKQNEQITIPQMLYSNGTLIAPEILDAATQMPLGKSLTPPLPKDFYDASHLLYGGPDAPHKLALFSDPVCPFCMDFVPEVIAFVKANPKQFALYYYHLPLLAIHPAAQTLVKAMLVAHKQGVKEEVLRVYKGEFDGKEKDVAKILKAFNTQLGTAITQKQLEEPWVKEHYERDIALAEALMISGTPTLLVNGKKDPTRTAFKALLK